MNKYLFILTINGTTVWFFRLEEIRRSKLSARSLYKGNLIIKIKATTQSDRQPLNLSAIIKLDIVEICANLWLHVLKLGGVVMNNDRIEREIFINASVQTVWELISQPAWWVGDAPGPDRVQVDGSRIVADTKYGKFTVLIEQEDSPNYLSCRWASSFPGEEPGEDNSTLVEFMLKEKDGGTWLSVVESGFSSLAVSEEEKHKFFKENVKGWIYQLETVRKLAEQ